MSASHRTYQLAPDRIQIGCGAAAGLAEIAAGLGRSPLVLADAGGRDAADRPLAELASRLPETESRPFAGECTQDLIEGLATRARTHDLLVGVGGGKALDAAKAAADRAGIPCITVPTSAATCAAYTPLSIVHEADGAYVESARLSRPVVALILDPDLIVTAPPRLLAAGIVDAMARAFDTILAARIDVPSETASTSLAICRQYLTETLLPLGDQALRDNRRGEATDVFTRVAEACILGAGLAGETGARFFGRSFSHAVAYALSHAVDPDCVLHGEAAGLGILVHCALDPEPPVPFEDMIEAMEAWGLPTSFDEVGANLSGRAGLALAQQTVDYLDLERAIPFAVEEELILAAMIAIDGGAPFDLDDES